MKSPFPSKSPLALLSLALGIASALSHEASAENMVITVNGTVATANPGMGYTVGQPVSFFWEVNDYAPATPTGYIQAHFRTGFVDQDALNDPPLFASVGGTGIAGTYRRAAVPYDYVDFYVNGNLSIEHGESNDGLFLAANPTFRFVYNFIDINLAAPGFSGFATPAVLPNPTTYIAGYVSTYTVPSFEDFEVVFTDGSTSLTATFAPTSVSIAAVPEPSAFAVSITALAGVALRWRRRLV